MWPESGLKVNTSYLRKTKIVPKQASSVTEGLSQNIVIEILSHCSLLQYYVEEYFSPYLINIYV